MKIKASVGRAGKDKRLTDFCQVLDLRAESGETADPYVIAAVYRALSGQSSKRLTMHWLRKPSDAKNEITPTNTKQRARIWRFIPRPSCFRR